jgi:glutamine amidotransferase-like uncharacterized protein
MKKICTFLLLFIVNSSFAQEQYDFAIYHDNNIGAWEDGIVAFEQFLNWKGVSHNRVTAQDINTITLKDFYRAIYFPGGDADYYNADINSTGIQNIQEMIADGGAYIGICAGAEFACDKLVWQGVTYNYPLNLFQGEAIGPIDDLAVWPSYAMTTLTMNLGNEINQFGSENEDMLYWGGSIFNPYTNTEFDTIATFDGFYDRPAIINFSYGNGRVLLISPHPEIEENSDRDSTNVAQELDDNGSDWNFLWTATDWLLGDTISNPNNLSTPSHSYNQYIQIYPNPTNKILNIAINSGHKIEKVAIYNQIGQNVLVKKPKNNTINLSCLQKGIYIIEVITNSIKIREKLIIED